MEEKALKNDSVKAEDIVQKAIVKNDSEITDGDAKTLEDAVKFLRENSEKRNFNQTFDIIINLKNLNVKREIINTTITLPHDKGKDVTVGIISDDAKGDDVITSRDMEAMAKNPTDAKKLVKHYNYFVASAPLMPTVGKLLGRYLAPAGKMPKPIPPKADPAPFVNVAAKSLTLRNNKQLHLQCAVGSEKSEDVHVIENVKAILTGLEKVLPKGKQNIRSVLLKLTMSRPVKVNAK